MAWQPPPAGNVNLNAAPYTPGGGAYAAYGQQQPQQGGNFYPPQSAPGGYGGYYQGGAGYPPGAYQPPLQNAYQDPYNSQQGSYYPSGGYGNQQQGGGYRGRGGSNSYQQGGYGALQQQQQQEYQPGQAAAQSPPNQQQQQQQPRPPQPQRNKKQASPTPAQATSAHDTAKLSLGGASAQPVAALPKKKGGGTLSLGKKKQEAVAQEATPATLPPAAVATASSASAAAAKEHSDTASKVASPTMPAAASPAVGSESSAGEKEEVSSPTAETVSKPASPTPQRETNEKDRSKLTGEELRESVKKEIARQRQQNKKQYKRDPRPHFNIVFCGHVDAGKSTISGHLLMEKGLVDQREMDKLRREAEINHREGWEYAYVMDVSEEERTKGITRETGAAYFETEKRRVTVLDAPGHKAFVPSMIGGATQADICVLVISSRTGEFETGFDKGGQTREHAMLVRTCGVKQMICVVNKMDEMGWDKERYDGILGKLKPFLRQNGYDEEKAKNLVFMPVAGLTGENLIKHVDPSHCDWYKGPTMMEVIDELVLPQSKTDDDVLCIPLVGAYKDDGKTFIYGKVESGSIAVGEKIQVLPTKVEAVVEGISIESTEFEKCYPGDNVHLRVRGIDEGDIHGGYVATSIPTSLRAVEFFQARIVILDVRNIISAGSHIMLHIHAAQEEASFHKLLGRIDRRTNELVEKNPACVKAGDVVIARIELDRPVVLEPHKDFDKLGRFMLRDDGRTIAIGVVTMLYESTHESLAKGAPSK